ncbi:hypothetical protein AYO44_12625 [Planctomycetaceae bacterium SCGC AG-212-F19]|nr:hypothetical protein AYO44_12625 [Planctomycetaceae bacterium SCGC AG-212-F19]
MRSPCWPWPLPDDPRVPISVIPNVAVQAPFQGQPPDPPRYSKQIMEHLIFEARQHASRYPLLGLYVDPRNAPAVKVYEREGFEEFSQTYTDPVDGILYKSMLLKLAPATPQGQTS